MTKNYLFNGFTVLVLVLLLGGCNSRQQKNMVTAISNERSDSNMETIKLIDNSVEKKVDVFIEGNYFTSYIYPSTIEKPVLYPLTTANGTVVTRGFPIENIAGERVDHPHHVGLWFNYGDVNGIDFWNNSDAIPADKKSNYGSILHKQIDRISSGAKEGVLEVSMEWVDHNGKAMLSENTTFIFRGTNNKRLIDRITKLTALAEEVSFNDNKEGLLGLRMVRELEHPSDSPGIFTDARGKASDVPSLDNEGVTGLYRSSEGIEGNDVWGTRGKWMVLSGKIKEEQVSVAILDHPNNVGYPTYWHARGYGLYAANPLGQKQMSGGKEELNFSLSAGESVTFRHRIIIYSGDGMGDEQVNDDFREFIK